MRAQEEGRGRGLSLASFESIERVVDAHTPDERRYADEERVVDGCPSIRNDLGQRCFQSGVHSMAAFPGRGAAEVAAITVCLFERARRRVCVASRDAGDLIVDCGVLDDEEPNGSCL